MAKRRQSEDVLQRRYVLRHLTRLERQWNLEFTSTDTPEARWNIRGRLQALESMRIWLKGAAKRASRPGGIGRR